MYFRRLLVRYVVMGDHSFLSIESDDFRNMILNLCKDAFIPSADTIKNDIINIFNNNLKEMRHKFQVSKLIIHLYLTCFIKFSL